MHIKRGTVLIALRKEYKRYALRMCWSFEQRGLNTRLVGDVPALLGAERELNPDAIILDAAIAEPRTKDVLQLLHERQDRGKTVLVLVDLPSEQEMDIREQWPDVDIIV